MVITGYLGVFQNPCHLLQTFRVSPSVAPRGPVARTPRLGVPESDLISPDSFYAGTDRVRGPVTPRPVSTEPYPTRSGIPTESPCCPVHTLPAPSDSGIVHESVTRVLPDSTSHSITRRGRGHGQPFLQNRSPQRSWDREDPRVRSVRSHRGRATPDTGNPVDRRVGPHSYRHGGV